MANHSSILGPMHGVNRLFIHRKVHKRDTVPMECLVNSNYHVIKFSILARKETKNIPHEVSFRKGNYDQMWAFLREKYLKEIVLKVNNHEEAWRQFKNSLLETQEKCLTQPKKNRNLKINTKCLNGKGKKAVLEKEKVKAKNLFKEEKNFPGRKLGVL